MTTKFARMAIIAAVHSGLAVAYANDDKPTKLGDHPAVVVQRIHKNATYDYASKFYPHPAWLYLYPEAPDVLAERARRSRNAAASADRTSARVAESAPAGQRN